MRTEILEIDPREEDLKNHRGIVEGGRILSQGGLVAFPTETVYGLGGNGLDPEAVNKIYQAKDRPSDNPLILHIGKVEDLHGLVANLPDLAKVLIDKFWPGPLTLVLPRQSHIPDKVTGGLDTVAVRMPSHPIARSLIMAAGVPIAAPSANRSGRPSPTLASHVIEDMNGRVEMIIDGGPCEMGIESTVVDFSGEKPMLLRPGGVSVEELEKLIGPLEMDEGVAANGLLAEKEFSPKSPGMKYRHYSPEAELIIIEGENDNVKAKLAEMIRESNGRLGVLLTREMAEHFSDLKPHVLKILGSRDNPPELAASLFKLLRQFDEEEVDMILAEGLPLHGLGLAVMNRLRKAAGYQIIRI